MSSSRSNLDPYNRGGMWAFVFSIAFSLVFFVWVAFFQGIDLKEIPEDLRQKLDQERLSQESEKVAPKADLGEELVSGKIWESSPSGIQKGQKAYRDNCAVCHGDTGQGDGPAGAAIGARNLVEGKWTVGGDSISLFKSITNGISGTSMAAFSQIEKEDRWAIVHFIRSITKNKVPDDEKALEEFATSAK